AADWKTGSFGPYGCPENLSVRFFPNSAGSPIDDNLSSSVNQSLGYDAVGRITSAEGLYGVLGYGYDATGNRTSITTDGLSQSYTINYMNNWLVKAGQTSRSYDANGNLTKQGADTFTYDSQNRLVAATVAGVTASYTYNHLDQRVTKTLNGHTRLLVYDLAGNLIEELDAATGDVLAEYIWLDGTPLGFVQSEQIYQVHVDHLGTPKALTDVSGQVVWKASYSPFGKASITTQGPTFNLRFPGQYYDAETGLHYNWRRYYDPATGRYITSDPLGLIDGVNTYGYVHGNPMSNTDPTGEFAFVGAGIGAGLELLSQLIENNGSWKCVSWSKVGIAGAIGAIGGGWASGVFRHASSGKSWFKLSQKWSNVSPRVRKVQGVPRGNELHHWAIQRNGKFGKYVPDSIKNHPWNLKSIPRDIHQNIHGNGPTPYSAFGRWWHGTPEWAKVAQASPVSGGLADSINDEGCGCAN
ncbi:RHS repeat domain-containing protein, partial [Salmonella sp. LPS 503/02]